jgi:release factor glutamine methyltransferase
MEIAAALAWARCALAPDSDTAGLDAELLLARVLDCNRAYLLTWPERTLDPAQEAGFRELVRRRAEGIPVAYLLGEAEFWSLPLTVTEHTLIPRPETELLVETALELIPQDAEWDIADLGTGSGAIALALASERPACRLHAVDASAEALAVARENAVRLGLAVRFHHGSWLEPLAGMRFQLIVSNPPYVAAADPHLSRGDVRHEPISALASGADGLDAIRHIVAAARGHLTGPGWLLIEHGYDQGKAVRELYKTNGYMEIHSKMDLGGQERLCVGRWG